MEEVLPLPQMIAAAEQYDIATLTLEETLVSRGVAIGVTVQHVRIRVLVNLGAARREGMELSSELLQLADLVDP